MLLLVYNCHSDRTPNAEITFEDFEQTPDRSPQMNLLRFQFDQKFPNSARVRIIEYFVFNSVTKVQLRLPLPTDKKKLLHQNAPRN